MKITFPPSTLAKLRALLAKRRNELSWNHEVGQLVEELIPKKRQRNYGAGDMRQLAVELEKEEVYALVLYQHRDFVFTYKPRDLPKLRGLKFAHICVLLGLNKAPREEFRRRCLKWKWSVRTLRANVRERSDKATKAGRPISANVVAGPKTALRRIVQFSALWQRQCVEPMEKNLNRLMKQLRRKATPELLQLAEEGRAALKIVLEKTNEVQLELDRLIRKAKKPRRQSA